MNKTTRAVKATSLTLPYPLFIPNLIENSNVPILLFFMMLTILNVCGKCNDIVYININAFVALAKQSCDGYICHAK